MKITRTHLLPFFLGVILTASVGFTAIARAEGDAALYALMQSMFSWLKDEMLNKIEGFFKDEANQLQNQMIDNFREAAKWESWPAGLQSQFSSTFYDLRHQTTQSVNTDAKNYLSYTQGSASGHNASSQPIAVISDMNTKYKEVQSQNPKCNLVNPQNVGSNDDGCTKKQLEYTNYLLSGVSPLPEYADTMTESPTGQQYELERKQDVTRLQLANKAIETATNDKLNETLDSAIRYLASINKDKIDEESPAAVARDTLLTLQTVGVLLEKSVETQIEMQRLLGVLVSQSEEAHQAYLRELQKNMAH